MTKWLIHCSTKSNLLNIPGQTDGIQWWKLNSIARLHIDCYFCIGCMCDLEYIKPNGIRSLEKFHISILNIIASTSRPICINEKLFLIVMPLNHWNLFHCRLHIFAECPRSKDQTINLIIYIKSMEYSSKTCNYAKNWNGKQKISWNETTFSPAIKAINKSKKNNSNEWIRIPFESNEFD